MTTALFSEDQRDALQELTNIGMGQAGASVAAVLGEFVQLSVPRILVLKPSLIPPALERIVGPEKVTAVRQGFHGDLRGEAVVVYGVAHCRELADLMGYDEVPDEATEHELLLDVSNVLIGACLGGLAEQISAEMGFSAPSLMATEVEVGSLLDVSRMDSPCALFVEVNFSLEKRSFACHLIMLLPEDQILVLRDAIDRFLASL
ncbi:hypothetical protein [Denitromonas halophila]|uniref:Chemotaxis protein CheC n=1 Tax=Denitromonas halophila TaxID=1629404 RepID=A0A557R0G1_9RHOO|nr:hypothetical protein [Denitromonas halophila]TVO58650.1 hypothetical protein FHP91_03015 [Denitromonas halophila]